MAVNTEWPRYKLIWKDLSENGGENGHVKLSFSEGQSSLFAVWAIFPLSHLALISTSDITKRAPCMRDKLSNGRS